MSQPSKFPARRAPGLWPMARMALVALLGLAPAQLLTSAPVHAAVVDRIVARINQEIVTLHDLRQAATPYLLQRGLSPALPRDPKQRQELLGEVLDELIDRKLLVQEARAMDVRVSDAEVDQWLAYTRQQQNMSEEAFREMIGQYGLRYEAYREVIRENLLKIRMVNMRSAGATQVSESEVEAAYQKRRGQRDQVQKAVTVRHIMVRPASSAPEDVQAAKERIASLRERVLQGEDFGAVAVAESQGPSAAQGGELGTFKPGELDPSFEKPAFALKKGELSPVLENPAGLHLLQVTEIEEVVGADAERLKATIRAELQQAAMERQLGSYLESLRSRAFVERKL